MAKVTLSPLITGIKGRLGGVVFRVSQSGETFVTRSPDMSAVVWSPAQEGHRRRFKAAIAYANAAMADPDVRAVYEKRAAEGNQRPFQMAVSDYFKGVDLLTGHDVIAPPLFGGVAPP
jgi:hypothetical protein